ncbi:hypothetical protein ALP31_02522, partial [Pseudomonas amygdali pv. morsprunorum]
HIWERPKSFEITRTPCGSELVREGSIPDDTSSVDVPALSRTMRIAAPVAPTGTHSSQAFALHHHCASIFGSDR